MTNHRKNAAILLPLAEAHERADEYVQGTYWNHEDQRGCSIGCSIEDAMRAGMLPEGTKHTNRQAIADLIYGGVVQLAELQDRIHEGLPPEDVPHLTPRILRAVAAAPEDANWQRVWHRWAATRAAGAAGAAAYQRMADRLIEAIEAEGRAE